MMEDKLFQVVFGNSEVSDLQLWIYNIEDTLTILDSKIDHFESLGLTDTVETLCEEYNRLNLEKINLEIALCKLKLKQLELEKELMTRE